MSDINPVLTTMFLWCNDITAIRHFYAELIGFEETFYDEERGWFTCNAGTTGLVFVKATEAMLVPDSWAKQPGFPAGVAEATSWVITVPFNDFEAIVQRLKDADVAYSGEPESPQEGHFAFFVRDPMGMTIEIYAAKSD